MHEELHIIVNKYEEIAKQIGKSSIVMQLLNQTYLSYIHDIIVIQLLPKFKVSQVKIYNRPWDN